MIYPENHDDHIKHVKNWLVSGKDHANKKTKESVSRVTNILEDILEKKEAKKQKIIFITLMLIIFVAIITIISFYIYSKSYTITLIIAILWILLIGIYIIFNKMEYVIIMIVDKFKSIKKSFGHNK